MPDLFEFEPDAPERFRDLPEIAEKLRATFQGMSLEQSAVHAVREAEAAALQTTKPFEAAAMGIISAIHVYRSLLAESRHPDIIARFDALVFYELIDPMMPL